MSTDEATPNYNEILRNFEMATEFLIAEFGVKPKVGWQLDPFGHSAVNAKLFSMMGLEAMVFARINENHKMILETNRDQEFRWRPKFSTKDTTMAGSTTQDH